MPPQKIDPIERFWSMVKSKTNTNDCWLWTGFLDKDGYGKFNKMPAHRFSWIIHNGDISNKFLVRHNCKKRHCVNPDHLYLYELFISPEIRFWEHIDKTSSPQGCWIWTGGTNYSKKNHNGGYGIYHKNKKSILAHRFSYELHYGKIPKNMDICHRCDNPPCVNPNHLFLATRKGNMEDMKKKNRSIKPSMRGENAPAAKLTKEQVLQIRKEYIPYKHGHGRTALAKKYGVCTRTILAIIERKYWKHI